MIKWDTHYLLLIKEEGLEVQIWKFTFTVTYSYARFQSREQVSSTATFASPSPVEAKSSNSPAQHPQRLQRIYLYIKNHNNIRSLNAHSYNISYSHERSYKRLPLRERIFNYFTWMHLLTYTIEPCYHLFYTKSLINSLQSMLLAIMYCQTLSNTFVNYQSWALFMWTQL